MNLHPWIEDHKYYLLVGVYSTVTAFAILRVSRQPYSGRVKAEQIETIFKGTTLAAVILGIGISGKINKPRSALDEKE